MLKFPTLCVGLFCASALFCVAQQPPPDANALLGRPILTPQTSLAEAQSFTEARLLPDPQAKSVQEWEALAARMRQDVLDRIVYRGEAAAWRDAKSSVVWLETIPGGPGYKIQKLRYEALPGLWIPALLYEPEKLAGKVPVALNVNGHEANGKAVDYKQIRCINEAKRGMLVLNVEWLGMGQLKYLSHGHMNQLDLCGTSGLAPFYLAMKRGLDLLLALDHADPERVVVSGLSGGGWQTILLSALDQRVTLANPVAGYSSFKTRVHFLSDLGDSEQTPVDLATAADYQHLTALRARATLLTYNAKDECCFKADHALPPLLTAAAPIFQLYDQGPNLRTHVNEDPGTHNYLKENREALYQMLKDHFYPHDPSFQAAEIPSEAEVKSSAELNVAIPDDNARFQTLALAVSAKLPHRAILPSDKEAAVAWRSERREKLHQILRAKPYTVRAERTGEEKQNETQAVYWRLKLIPGGQSRPETPDWTVPVTELVRGTPHATVILIADVGKAGVGAEAEKLLAAGYRVLAVDPLGFGEAKFASHGYLFGLLISAVGERALGVAASQVGAVARWAQTEFKTPSVTLVAIGPRTSTLALVAAGLDEHSVQRLELHASLGSLKEIIEQNRDVKDMPEMFCFGLLEEFDILQLAGLFAPRKAEFHEASDRVKRELTPLKDYFKILGVVFDSVR